MPDMENDAAVVSRPISVVCKTSAPAPPIKTPPSVVSLDDTMIVSLPAPARMISPPSPPLPVMVSSSAPPKIISPELVPVILSAPAPAKMMLPRMSVPTVWLSEP